MSSANNGDVDGVNKALAELKDPSAVVDIERNNALHEAATSGHPAIVERLLRDERFDVNAVNDYRETALFKAVSQWNLAGSLEIHHTATRRDYIEIVKLLLNASGIKPELSNRKGSTIIHAAIPDEGADMSMLNMLLMNTNVNPKKASPYYGEPIHVAVSLGNLAAVDTLLKDRRVDPTSEFNFARDGLMSPLEMAYAQRHKPIALRLLEETRVMETITPSIRRWVETADPGNHPINIEEMIKAKAWQRRRHAICEFYRQQKLRGWIPKYEQEAEAVLGNNAACNNAKGGKRTRRNKRRVGRRMNAIGRTRHNKRRVGR